MKKLKKSSEKVNFYDYTDYKSRLRELNFVGKICIILNNLCNQSSLTLILRFFQRPLKRYRKQIYAVSVLLIITLLQATFFNYVLIFNLKPDAILAALVIFVPFFSLRWSVTFAFLGGIFRDIFSILPFGNNVIICILWIILAKQIFRRLSIENNFIRITMLCLIILLNNFTIQSILFILGKPIVIGSFLRIVSIESALTLLLALPMYRLFVHLFMD